MPEITIDQQTITARDGDTVLEAATGAGLDIPTLCYFKGNEPCPSCMACAVKDTGKDIFIPSCAVKAEDGMKLECETDEVHEFRKTAIELLFSDHLGDCISPCQRICPAHLEIPLTMKLVRAGKLREAIVAVKRSVALPAVLGRTCHRPCESGCRRGTHDDAVSICSLIRHVADEDLASGHGYLPPCGPPRNKSIAIVGAGPAGLSAAYYLLQEGYACTLYEQSDRPGGTLNELVKKGELPEDVVASEIGLIEKLGANLRFGIQVGSDVALETLQQEHDAVLLSIGKVEDSDIEAFGLKVTRAGIQVGRESYETELEGVFAAGHAVRKTGKVVHSVADGKTVAAAIHQHLSGFPIVGQAKSFTCQVGKLQEGEMPEFMKEISEAERTSPAAGQETGFSFEEAVKETERCVQCDCRAIDTCKLRDLAIRYGASPTRFDGDRPTFRKQVEHPFIIYEPGKCIRCGNCVRIAEASRESLGLTFVGRGFDVQLGVPFNGTLREGLKKVAAECVAACPVGALALKDE
ncbi:MAG: FAD-dependent oxidoreductase [Planctomycetota bacterium]|jgi:ferredoxin|nr:FAD-dependent oxidoreductase [Planctomycetota bacterium]